MLVSRELAQLSTCGLGGVGRSKRCCGLEDQVWFWRDLVASRMGVAGGRRLDCLFFIFLFSFENVEGQLTNALCIVYIFIYWCTQEGQVCGWRDCGCRLYSMVFLLVLVFFSSKKIDGEGQLTKPPCLFSLGPVTAVGS